MLQIRNSGSGKSEWNVGATHLIIPMIDGDLISNKEKDKLLTSAITLNPVQGSDQTILTNTLEHSLVVGLDKNLFEPTNYKSDLLIIQNPDLKLLQYNTDIKVAHTLSDVGQDKSEILWQSPILKDRISGNEKAIFEVKQTLNYDQIDLEKTTKQNNLENITIGKGPVYNEAEKEVFTGGILNQEKNITDSSYITNFNSENDKSKSICISLSPESSKTVGKKKTFQNDMNSELNNIVPSYKLGESFAESIFNSTNTLVSHSDSLPITSVDYSKQEYGSKDKILSRKTQVLDNIENSKIKKSDGINDFFPEKNLPLKKKAKMKSSLVAASFDNQKALIKNDLAHKPERVSTRRNAKQTITRPQKKEKLENSDSAVIKISKPKKLKQRLPKNPVHNEVKKDLTKMDSVFRKDKTTAKKTKLHEFVVTKFNDIYELVKCLLKCRMISTAVWKILNSGLREMNIDILKEMLHKKNEKCSPKSSNYSPHLKAFALVLYFKQPSAFNRLSQAFKNGWPSLKVIKEWMQRINTRRRRKVV